MNLLTAYSGRSYVRVDGGAAVVRLEPNLAREAVAFDATMRHPLRFREAISTLHDIVTSDLRFKRRNDRAAYEEWRKSQAGEEQAARAAGALAYKEQQARVGPPPTELKKSYEKARSRYWKARLAYADHLQRHDWELFRLIMPCDPIVTVAGDVVLFECFSSDESSYGCLSVDRSAFETRGEVRTGTTNVDYSWDLFHEFQSLRTYRETRLCLAPAGVTVKSDNAEYREEKIDLPSGWLRGFLQVQAAMALPARRVLISRDALYAVLSQLRRHREPRSPRALRIELVRGCAPELILEPWEIRIPVAGPVDDGPPTAPIRVWGKRRLLALARLLPLVDHLEVFLPGTGMPSFWVARMGEMSLTLGMSGWTANDWTSTTAMDALLPPVALDATKLSAVAKALHERHAGDLGAIAARAGTTAAETLAALQNLAHHGQAIFDLAHGVYRWRSVMPVAVAEGELGPPNPEAVAARAIEASREVKKVTSEAVPNHGTLVKGTVESQPVEALLDADGRIVKGSCRCAHHFKAGLRKGPCRHLLALRSVHLKGGTQQPTSLDAWYERFLGGRA